MGQLPVKSKQNWQTNGFVGFSQIDTLDDMTQPQPCVLWLHKNNNHEVENTQCRPNICSTWMALASVRSEFLAPALPPAPQAGTIPWLCRSECPRPIPIPFTQRSSLWPLKWCPPDTVHSRTLDGGWYNFNAKIGVFHEVLRFRRRGFAGWLLRGAATLSFEGLPLKPTNFGQ